MPTRRLSKEEERQTFLALFLGPLAWFLHLSTLNVLSSLSCKWGWFNFVAAGMPGLKLVELLVSLAFLLVMLYLVYLPWRNWRRFQTASPLHNPRLLQQTEADRRPLAAFVALAMNALLTLFVLASFLLLFALKACAEH